MQCVSCESLSNFIEFYENMKVFLYNLALARAEAGRENHFPMCVESIVVLNRNLKSKSTTLV